MKSKYKYMYHNFCRNHKEESAVLSKILHNFSSTNSKQDADILVIGGNRPAWYKENTVDSKDYESLESYDKSDLIYLSNNMGKIPILALGRGAILTSKLNNKTIWVYEKVLKGKTDACFQQKKTTFHLDTFQLLDFPDDSNIDCLGYVDIDINKKVTERRNILSYYKKEDILCYGGSISVNDYDKSGEVILECLERIWGFKC
jgi:hypothetical protein